MNFRCSIRALVFVAALVPLLHLTGPALAKSLNDYLAEGNRALEASRYQEAQNAFTIALKLAGEQGKESERAVALSNLSIAYIFLGQYETALSFSNQALVIHRKLKDSGNEGVTLHSLGIIYGYLGQYEKALESFQQSLPLLRKGGNSKAEAGSLVNIGSVYRELGQYEKALEYHQQGLQADRRVGNQKGEGNALTNIGNVYISLGQYDKALEYYQQGLDLHKKVGNRFSEGNTLTSIGNVYAKLGQYETSVDYHLRAVAVGRESGNINCEGAALTNIAYIYLLLEQYGKALDYAQQGLAVHRKTGHLQFECEALGTMGEAYRKQGQYEKALDQLQQALAIARKIGDTCSSCVVLDEMALTLLATGKPDKAAELLTESIRDFETLRAGVHSDKERTGFQGAMPELYGHLAASQVLFSRPQSAFEAIERGRSKSFLDLMGTQTLARKRSKDKIPELARLETDLSRLRDERVQVASAPSGSKTRSASAIDQSISETDRKRMNLIDQMRRSDPELGSLAVVDAPSLREIQSMLSPGTLLAEYYHCGEYVVSNKKINELWVFLVHRDGLELKKAAVTKDELQSALDRYALLLADRSSSQSELQAASAKLNNWLVEPVQPLLARLKPNTLIIVPWRSMFKVPFASLAAKGKEPLGAGRNIVVAPSAGVYRYVIGKRASGRGNILAFGNPQTSLAPLPGAEQEVREIVSLFNTSTVRTGTQATEKLLKADTAELGHPDVIHLACHGIFNDKVPELSYLALTPDQQNDGKLEMHELFDLDWKGVSLVTLSACSSGKGKLGAGDDLVGMVRGFLFAGTPSVLSSLWDVDDEATRTLMVSFYKNYTSGMSKPESLKNAQLAMMKNPKWSHPYYWSAFVLFGDWE